MSKKDDTIVRRQLNVIEHLRREFKIGLARLDDLEQSIREHRSPKGAGQIALVVDTGATLERLRASRPKVGP